MLLLNFAHIGFFKIDVGRDVTCYLHVFVKRDTYCCFMDLSNFVTWTFLSYYMKFSKLLHGFVKVVTCICQSCSMYFMPFAKQTQADV